MAQPRSSWRIGWRNCCGSRVRLHRPRDPMTNSIISSCCTRSTGRFYSPNQRVALSTIATMLLRSSLNRRCKDHNNNYMSPRSRATMPQWKSVPRRRMDTCRRNRRKQELIRWRHWKESRACEAESARRIWKIDSANCLSSSVGSWARRRIRGRQEARRRSRNSLSSSCSSRNSNCRRRRIELRIHCQLRLLKVMRLAFGSTGMSKARRKGYRNSYP